MRNLDSLIEQKLQASTSDAKRRADRFAKEQPHRQPSCKIFVDYFFDDIRDAYRSTGWSNLQPTPTYTRAGSTFEIHQNLVPHLLLAPAPVIDLQPFDLGAFRRQYHLSPRTVLTLAEQKNVLLNLYERSPDAWGQEDCQYMQDLVNLSVVNGERIDQFFSVICPRYQSELEYAECAVTDQLRLLGEHSQEVLSNLLETQGKRVTISQKARREARRFAYLAALAPDKLEYVRKLITSGELQQAFEFLFVWKELATPYTASLGGDVFWKPAALARPEVQERLARPPAPDLELTEIDGEIMEYIKEKVVGLGLIEVPCGVDEKNLVQFLGLSDRKERRKEMNDLMGQLARQLNAKNPQDKTVSEIEKVVEDVRKQLQDLKSTVAGSSAAVLMIVPLALKWVCGVTVVDRMIPQPILEGVGEAIAVTSNHLGEHAGRLCHPDNHRMLTILDENRAGEWMRQPSLVSRFEDALFEQKVKISQAWESLWE